MKWLFVGMACLFSAASSAQKPVITFDHLSLQVKNLEASVGFYSGLLQLDTIANTFPGFPTKWYSIGNNIQMHLIQGTQPISPASIFQHPCFSVTDIDAFIARLKVRNITYYDARGNAGKIQVRADGVTQLFIKDPDDNWVEINNKKH